MAVGDAHVHRSLPEWKWLCIGKNTAGLTLRHSNANRQSILLQEHPKPEKPSSSQQVGRD